MSTQNSETLKLYRHTKLYNGSRYKFYHDNRDYDVWLGTPGYVKTVYYKSISEPIPIKEFIKDADQYTYGSITNQDKIYYFFVDDISTDAYGQTMINFTIDWWSTNWENINCTKAHISRQNINKPQYMEQPYTPLNVTYNSQPMGGDRAKTGSIMFTYIPSVSPEPSYISLGILDLTEENIAIVQNGYWQQEYRIAGADIKDCFIVPMVRPEDIIRNIDTIKHVYEVDTTGVSGSNTAWKLVHAFEEKFPQTQAVGLFSENGRNIVQDLSNGKYYALWWTVNTSDLTIDWHSRELTEPFGNDGFKKVITKEVMDLSPVWYRLGYYMTVNDRIVDKYEFELDGLNITSTDKFKMGVQDWNSDSIWECPYGMTITSFRVRVLTGVSHLMLEFIPQGKNNNGEKITGGGFCYDCRHPGLFVDSYKDYVLKNRDYDIQMRKIQSDKQEIGAWMSTAENIGFGFAFGQSKGAAAAGVGGMIEAVSTHFINKIYDPKIQEQYDARYMKMTDQISLVGDSITNVINEINNGLLKIYTITMDEATQQRMDTDIEVNGYYTDEIVSNLNNLFDRNVVIQADNTVVEGACNVIGKQQVVERLMNGVEFI